MCWHCHYWPFIIIDFENGTFVPPLCPHEKKGIGPYAFDESRNAKSKEKRPKKEKKKD